MLCSLLNREGVFQCFRSVLIFVDYTFFSPVMGCFFDCFSIRDDDRRHRRSSNRRHREATTENRLSSLFLSEEKEDSHYEVTGSLGVGSPLINKELRDEAKFLKACGTIPETPTEIRKASGKLNHLLSNDESDPSKSHPWLQNKSIKTLQMDGKPDQPYTPVKVSEEWCKGSAFSERTPSSCISHVQSVEDDGVGSVHTELKIQIDQDDDTVTSVSPLPPTTDGHGRTKSVRFERNFDKSFSGSSSGNDNPNSKKSGSPGNQSVTKCSPYPTPQKLSDEMQTPGTFFPPYVDNVANGKTRIRSQYVYSVPNPVENVSSWKVEDSYSRQISGELGEHHVQPDSATPKSEAGANKSSAGNELNAAEASLSSWFKPLTSTEDRDLPRGYPPFGRTPGDRPIIGTVAAHWNEDEPTKISPKWWDGNGIPNSTNKYKEDQKVSWHATPFEERLEKALSEEGVTSKRKPISGTPIMYDENEESDTGLSQFQSSTASKSVISF